MGTLNFLGQDKVKRAVSLVEEGATVSCARTVMFEPAPDIPIPPIHFMTESGEGWATGDKVTSRTAQGSTDFFGMIFHGYAITHVDSLAHFFWEGKMYNNQPRTPGSDRARSHSGVHRARQRGYRHPGRPC